MWDHACVPYAEAQCFSDLKIMDCNEFERNRHESTGSNMAIIVNMCYNMTFKLYTKHDPTCSISIFMLSPSRTSGFHALVMVCSHVWMLGAIGICIAVGCRLQRYDTSYFGKI